MHITCTVQNKQRDYLLYDILVPVNRWKTYLAPSATRIPTTQANVVVGSSSTRLIASGRGDRTQISSRVKLLRTLNL